MVLNHWAIVSARLAALVGPLDSNVATECGNSTASSTLFISDRIESWFAVGLADGGDHCRDGSDVGHELVL